MVDIRQTPIYATYLKEIGWKIEKTESHYAFIKTSPVAGSIIKIQRPVKIDKKEINSIAKKYKALQMIIEPHSKPDANILIKEKYAISKSPYLPTKTLHVDLTKTRQELFNDLKKDARYSLRKTKEIKIYSVDNYKSFRKSWRNSVDWRRWVPSWKNLEILGNTFNDDSLFLITPDGESGAIFLKAGSRAYYWQAFTSKKGRKNLSQYKIVWAGMLWAKDKNVKIFDFEGIYDKRFPNKKWVGFSHFKKSFGGLEVEYPGTYTKFFIPI